MRLLRGLGVNVVLCLSLLALSGLLAPAALGNHDPEHAFAGDWNTSYPEVPTFGTINFRFVGDEEGKAALAAIPGALGPCPEPSDYYVGTFTRGTDTGTHAGCTLGNLLTSSFHSDGFGVNGWFNATLSSSTSWSGEYGVYGGAGGQWSGMFKGHLGDDGATNLVPFKIDISLHANNLPTSPPNCPRGTRARITGKIEAQLTPFGEIQGGGDLVATPHRSRCRVPVIDIAVDDIELRVIEPGKIIQATLAVHITQGGNNGNHKPGDCRVGTRGTIVATYDDTVTAANGLPNYSLRVGPWERRCRAHTHPLITNSITSIPADASSSTWVRVWIGCAPEPLGYSPANCS
jgi:hypothetical protein